MRLENQIAAGVMLSGVFLAASSPMTTEEAVNKFISSEYSYTNKTNNEDVSCINLFTYNNNSINDIKYDENGTNIDPIFFIKNNFIISSNDIAYIKAFDYTFSDLLKLKNIVKAKYENYTSIELKRCTIDINKGLMVAIHINTAEEDVDTNVDKLFEVCDEWFSKTNDEIAEKVYIDVVV